MEWYLPITILPAVGLLIMSTTSQMMGLSAEIGDLLKGKCSPFQHKISDMKIKQLTRLTISTTLLYLSAATFVVSGLINATVKEGLYYIFSEYILITGVFLVLLALMVLIIYGFKAISIRKMQHHHNHQL